MKTALIALVAALCLAAPVSAQDGPGTINWYRSLNNDADRYYFFMGVVAGGRRFALGGAMYGNPTSTSEDAENRAYWFWARRGPNDRRPNVRACTDEWTFAQGRAVFERYIEAHPEIWHESVAIHVAIATVEACDR